jgi:hypothetical protein
MQINITWDTSGVTSPVVAEFEAAVNYVVNLYDPLLTARVIKTFFATATPTCR